MTSVKDLAVQAALKSNWQEACDLNEQLLKENGQDIDSLNRYGFSLLKLYRYSDAEKVYQSVIQIDPSNPIALKNLKKLQTLSKNSDSNSKSQKSNSEMNMEDLFLEEAGKTKTVELVNLADKKILSYLQPGDIVVITPKRSKIFLLTTEKQFIGMLPDSIGMRLNSFIKGGNEYSACIKSVNDKSVAVFVRETKRAAKFKNQQSFFAK